ncbi:MAG: hypothetical protein JJV89_03235 [Desulfosarcina sp.]|nr:hypothetical protein [Desulfobacterales bacterium]
MSFDTFRQIIKESKTCGNRRRVEFLETDKNSKLKKVEIMGFTTENAIKFSFDGKKELSPYLSHSGNHLKACDAVLLAEIDDQNYLLFIEMKSESINKCRISKQFASSLCFMDYCDSIMKRFYKSDLIDRCKKRFVVFYKASSIHKTTTQYIQKTDQQHDCPDNPLFFPYNKPVRIKRIL